MGRFSYLNPFNNHKKNNDQENKKPLLDSHRQTSSTQADYRKVSNLTDNKLVNISAKNITIYLSEASKSIQNTFSFVKNNTTKLEIKIPKEEDLLKCTKENKFGPFDIIRNGNRNNKKIEINKENIITHPSKTP